MSGSQSPGGASSSDGGRKRKWPVIASLPLLSALLSLVVFPRDVPLWQLLAHFTFVAMGIAKSAKALAARGAAVPMARYQEIKLAWVNGMILPPFLLFFFGGLIALRTAVVLLDVTIIVLLWELIPKEAGEEELQAGAP